MFKTVFIPRVSVRTSNVDQVRRNACTISAKGKTQFTGNVRVILQWLT